MDGTTIKSTGETGEPSAAAANKTAASHRSVWYKWSAPSSGVYVFDTCTNPTNNAFDSQLGVYTGTSLPSLNQVVVDDNPVPTCGVTGKQSKVWFTTTATTQYYILVDGKSPAGFDAHGNSLSVVDARGDFKLSWSCVSGCP